MQKLDIFCPECAKLRGKQKKLLEIDKDTARGIILPWCKVCHKNVTIDIDKLLSL